MKARSDSLALGGPKPMSRLAANAGLILCLMLMGCATLDVSVDYDTAANLAALRTYDWSTSAQEKAGDLLIDSDTLLQQRVVSAVEGELARRGYRRTRQQPEFLISFFFTRAPKLGAAGYPSLPIYGGFFGGPYAGYWGSGYYYPGYYGYGMYPRPYEEGLLVIDFVDPTSRKLLWRGMVRDVIRFQESPENRNLRIHRAVAAALQRFPP